LEGLCEEPAILVGHGMGAHVSLLATFQRKDLVAGLMLADGAPWYVGVKDGVEGGMPREFLDGAASASGLSYPDTLYRTVENWMFYNKPSDALAYALVQDGLTWPLFVADEYDRNMESIDHRSRLETIECPTSV